MAGNIDVDSSLGVALHLKQKYSQGDYSTGVCGVQHAQLKASGSSRQILILQKLRMASTRPKNNNGWWEPDVRIYSYSTMFTEISHWILNNMEEELLAGFRALVGGDVGSRLWNACWHKQPRIFPPRGEETSSFSTENEIP